MVNVRVVIYSERLRMGGALYYEKLDGGNRLGRLMSVVFGKLESSYIMLIGNYRRIV
jgi:hypothetical protein